MAKSNRSIIVFTRWFPYNKVLEQSFLLDELRILSDHFSKVYVVPQTLEGEKYLETEEFKVEESLAHQLERVSIVQKMKAIVSISFLIELFKVKFDPLKIRYAIAMRVGAVVTADWIQSFVDSKKEIVLYSFWLDRTAYGSVLVRSNSIVKRVARCHNFDLYGNEENKFYAPFRLQIVTGLDLVLPDSFEGERFLKNHYPHASIRAGIMGTTDLGHTNVISEDGTLRIISCAYMIPRKRVLLFAEALKVVNDQCPDLKINWVHVGEGVEMEAVRSVVKHLGDSVKVELVGNLSTEDLRHLYDTNNFDLFVNTSTKEGTPVAILEAISRGIPLMATAFGGGKEIVEKGAGILLPIDPTPKEIADNLISITKDQLVVFGKKSREVWELNYSSNKNYRTFCSMLDER